MVNYLKIMISSRRSIAFESAVIKLIITKAQGKRRILMEFNSSNLFILK